MEFTQKQAIEIYRVVRKLEYQDMDGMTANTLFNLREAFEPRFKFQDEQEKKLIDKLLCSVDNTGAITFPNVEAQKEYIGKISEIDRIKVDIAISKTKIDISGIKISPHDIGILREVAEIVFNNP